MLRIAGDWIKSEYITIDSDGWHCADDAPEDIKRQYEEFMDSLNMTRLIEPEDE